MPFDSILFSGTEKEGDNGPDALYSVGTLANKLYIFSTGGKRKSS